ncbi:hypothetical protein L484_009347 [Morus notabilis]|uniref:DUF7812 domain-containing protein n=1 Tax=Morus notabilis TaxID=981085 RepID=W9RGD3_9ROSA|nr:hypothetical protein L484_009347 [Morus notabilis]
MFHTHLILLVSEAIGVSMSSNIRPSVRLMACYLTAFERSVILYTRYMSTLLMDGHPIGSKDSYANHGSFGRRSSSIPAFTSAGGPQEAEYLFELVSKHLSTMGVPDKYWVEFTAFKFECPAGAWWKHIR